MGVNYDYKCIECQEFSVLFSKYEERDDTKVCEHCGGEAERCFVTPPQVRTEKLSRTFVDGHKRRGMEDLKKIADLQVEQLKHSHKEQRYHEIGAEIEGRKQLKPKKVKGKQK